MLLYDKMSIHSPIVPRMFQIINMCRHFSPCFLRVSSRHLSLFGRHIFRFFLADYSMFSSTLGKDLSLKVFGNIFPLIRMPKSRVWNTIWHQNQALLRQRS